MPSHLIVGHVTGEPAHGSTVVELFPMADMFCSKFGKLCIIRTDLMGVNCPFLI